MQPFRQRESCSFNIANSVQINAEFDDAHSYLKTPLVVTVKNSHEQLFAASKKVLSEHSLVAMQSKSDFAFWLAFRDDLDSDSFYQYFMHFIKNDINIDKGLLAEVKQTKRLRLDKIQHTKSYIEVLFQASIKLKKLRIIACALEYLNIENQVKQARSFLIDPSVIKKKKNENYAIFCNFLIKAYSDTYKDYQVNRKIKLPLLADEKLEELRIKLKNKMASVEKMTRTIKINQTLLQEKNKEVMNLIDKTYAGISAKTQMRMDLSLKKEIAKEKTQAQAQAAFHSLMQQLTKQTSFFCDAHDIDTFDCLVEDKYAYVELLVAAWCAKTEIVRIKNNMLHLMVEEKNSSWSLVNKKAREKSIQNIRKTHLKLLTNFVKHALKHQKCMQELQSKAEESSKTLRFEAMMADDCFNKEKIKMAQRLCKQEMNDYNNALNEHPEFSNEMLINRLNEYLQEGTQIKALMRMIIERLATEVIQNTPELSVVESLSNQAELIPLFGDGCQNSSEQRNISGESLSLASFPSPEKITLLRKLLSQPFANETQETLLKCRALLAYYESTTMKENFTFEDNQGKVIRSQQIEYWNYCFLHGDLPLLRGSYEFNNQKGFHAEHLFEVYSTLINNPHITIAELSRECKKPEQALFELLSRIGFSYDMDTNTGMFSWKLIESTPCCDSSACQAITTHTIENESPSPQSLHTNPDSQLALEQGQPARKKIKTTERQSKESTKVQEMEELNPDGFNLLNYLNQDSNKDFVEPNFAEEFDIDYEFSESFFANLDEITTDNQQPKATKLIAFKAVSPNYEPSQNSELPNITFE